MLYLAPIRGITDRIYRNCLAKHFPGIDIAMTPFVQTQKGDQIKPSHLQENQNGTPPTHTEKIIRLKTFHDDLLAAYINRLSGANHQITRMLAHWEYLGRDLPDIDRAMKRMRKAKTITDYRIVVTKLLQSG